MTVRARRQERLAKLLSDMNDEHGPVPKDIQREVASWWPDAGDGDDIGEAAEPIRGDAT